MSISSERPRTKTNTGFGEPTSLGTSPELAWVFPAVGTSTRPTAEPRTIGRGDECHTRLPGETISWCHAEVNQLGGSLTIEDLGSRNGTRVNGQQITQATTLRPGDIVRCGEWIGCVVEGASSRPSFGEIAPGLWGGPTLSAALDPARRLAPKGFPMILEGKTGVGKERAAAAIHSWSGRNGEFVGVNCAAIPADLAEAELFGHTKGAFSGADRARIGYLRQADGGTLLLDEFAELPLPLQAKLLRALQESEVRPVGGSQTHPIDILVLAAAQTPVGELVEAGQLREDLAARLSDLTIKLPAIADRREDIPPLFMLFMKKYAEECLPRVDSGLVEWLCLVPWRHNVRGLERLARTMLALHGERPVLTLKQVPENYRQEAVASPQDKQQENEVLFQRIVRALSEHDGNVSQASKALGLDRSKVRRILKERPEFDVSAIRKKP